MQANDLEVLLRSRVPIVVIESRDEAQVLKGLVRACMQVLAPLPVAARAGEGAARGGESGALPGTPGGAGRGLPLFRWTVTDGLKRLDVDMGPPQRIVSEPLEILRHIRATTLAGVYALLDFHPYLHDPTIVRLLKDIAQDYGACARTLVLIGYATEIPPELEPLSARLALALPVEKMSGLTAADTQRLARSAIADHGAIQVSDVPKVMRAKYELLNHGGVLRYEHDTAQLSDVGGLGTFKAWLQKRCAAFDGSAPGLDPPRGVLLLGVQGCGKSLAARASAGILNIPLLRLDCAALFDKYVGESERNLRESLASADVLAPCVLWIDEIEKGSAAGDSDGGATRRVLGAFLTWLAEKSSRVFVVATANDISALPPELIRKGRFDEIFFVDLPDLPTRAEILRIHAAKRGISLDAATLTALAQACGGFAGAEIEQAVVAALYTAHAQKTLPNAQLLGAEIAATRPLEGVMAEKVAALRTW